MLDLVEVLFRSTEFAGADGSSEDDDGEDETEEGEDATSESALHLTEKAGSEVALQHCCMRRHAVNQKPELGDKRGLGWWYDRK